MTKRQGLRAIIFIFILSGICLWLNSALGTPKTDDVILMTRRFDEMRSDSKDSWDGILVGTSVADRAWAAPLAWEEHGMAVYPMSTDGQPLMMTTNLIEEVLRYQDISFVAVELHGSRPGLLTTNGSRIRWITENMKPSLHKLETIRDALAYMNQWYPGRVSSGGVSDLSFYLPIIKFHSRLTRDKFYKGDFDPGETQMKGVYEAKRHMRVKSVAYTPYEGTTELNEEQTGLLDEIMDYCERKGLQLVFVNTPSALKEESMAMLNAACDYVEAKGYPVLNFNEAAVKEASGISGKTDFIDLKHLNTRGARKFTEYFGEWLKENLELPDHRGESGYESWDEAAEVYGTFYEESCGKD